MAYRRSRGKATKIEPAVKTLIFVTPSVGSGTVDEFYIDLSQCASLYSRRFYRQGLQWAVSGIKMLSSIGAGALPSSVVVQKLPETWAMSNAWEKGFRAWQRMNNEALEETPSVKPRFLDFKIYADAQHHKVGFGANLLPTTLTQVPAGPHVSATAVLGEWEASKFIIPKTDGTDDTNSREVVAVGANYPGVGASTLQAVSLIEGYAASRGLPEIVDPNVPDDASDANSTTPENWLAATFNEGTDQDAAVLSDMITENNQAPYPFENAQVPGAAPGVVFTDTHYPNGANNLGGLQIHDLQFISVTTIGGTTRIPGGLFPCGLMKIIISNESGVSGNATFQIDLVPGTHRGYLCEPMTEM